VNRPGVEVIVDLERCMGSGVCMFHAPNTFDVDDDGKAVVVAVADPLDALRNAAESCPQSAITLFAGASA
jgi:ferredoxin